MSKSGSCPRRSANPGKHAATPRERMASIRRPDFPFRLEQKSPTAANADARLPTQAARISLKPYGASFCAYGGPYAAGQKAAVAAFSANLTGIDFRAWA